MRAIKKGDICILPPPDNLSNVIKHYEGEVGIPIGFKAIEPLIIDVLKLDMFFYRAKVPSKDQVQDTTMMIKFK